MNTLLYAEFPKMYSLGQGAEGKRWKEPCIEFVNKPGYIINLYWYFSVYLQYLG